MNDTGTAGVLRDALREIQRLRRDNRRLSAGDREPVAVVGMACRYPGGVEDPDGLWDVVAGERTVIGAMPGNRGWHLGRLYDPDPDVRGTTYVRDGGFLSAADLFDPAFFDISPREALAMDPQQRLLLETSWEALERARIAPSSLRGRDVGVFTGYCASYYGYGTDEIEGYGTGQTASVAAGRVAYVLGLHGPAVTLDTACSSSLVALHLATRSLRSGECSLALAGAAMVLSTPDFVVDFSRQRGLAPDARCKAFAEAADGTVIGEGAGVLVLERLSDARRNGHPVLAVVRGTAINHDGASNGLTAPNGPAQQRVIRAALKDAGLEPSDVDVIEAHGTGTALGDPIEAHALLATYGQRGSAEPAWLGSVKSNLGHAQIAAGVAGVIKMVQAMRHGVAPRTLHVDKPSSHVLWDSGAVRLLTETRPWPETGRPRRAAVSGFGISGTNAHVILEQGEPEEPAVAEEPAATRVPLLVSGRSWQALRAQADRLASWLDRDPGAGVAGVARSLRTTRTSFEHRAVILAAGAQEAGAALRALGRGEPDERLVTGTARGGRPRTVFLFTGQGGQRPGAGQELYRRFPEFAHAFDTVCAELDGALGGRLAVSVRDVFLADPALERAQLVHRTQYTQLVLFAVEIALQRLLASFGVVPDVVFGHSVGALAAAHVAGALDLAGAATLVAERGLLMAGLPAGGVMVALDAPESDVVPLLEGQVSIAAVNGPSATVVSGAEDAVAAVLAGLPGIRHRRLSVSHAFHSPLMDPIVSGFRAVAERISVAPPRIPMISDVTGEEITAGLLGDPDYWADHLSSPVRFLDGIRTLEGAGLFVECGPDAVLTALARRCLAGSDGAAAFTAVLRRGRDENDSLLTTLAQAHVRGVDVRWDPVLPDSGGRPVSLPTYAFQRQRYWLDPARGSAGPQAGADWLYQIRWRPVTVAAPVPRPSGTWLMVTATDDAENPLTATVRRALEESGARVSAVAVDAAAREVPGALEADVAGVVVLPMPLPATVALVQAWARTEATVPMWLVTRGAVAPSEGEAINDPDGGQVWGLGLAAGLEMPDRWGGVVDLLPGPRAAAALAMVLGGIGEGEVAIRDTGIHARRLVRGRDGLLSGPEWKPRGTVLVTGGTGGLGAEVARWAAANGAEHLVLVSRRGPAAPGARQLEADLAAAGVAVTIQACDVSDADALAAVTAEHRFTAVVHAAGINQIGRLAETTAEDIVAPLGAKVTGAAHLDRVFHDTELDAFVLFSSIAGVWGSGGQAGYAAGNAYLDALAEHRRSRGLAATAVAWGPWADVGGAIREDHPEQLAGLGLALMSPAKAIAVVARLAAQPDPTVTVADVDWSRFAPIYTSSRPSRLLAEVAPAPAPPEGAFRDRFSALAPGQRQTAIADLVREAVATTLGHPGGPDLDDRPFGELGVDSITALEFSGRLGAATGLELPVSLVFDHPTPAAVTAHLLALLADGEGAPEAGTILAGLDRIDRDFSELDATERAAVVRRLRALADKWTRPAAEPGGDLADATDDELFDFIKEIGVE